MEILLQYLLLLAPLAWELITDKIDIDKGIKDRKGRDVVFRVVAMVALGFINRYYVSGVGVIQHVIYSFCIFFSTFDYLLNVIRGIDLLYLGTNPFDEFKKGMPLLTRIFVELFVLMVGVSIYYNLDKIL